MGLYTLGDSELKGIVYFEVEYEKLRWQRTYFQIRSFSVYGKYQFVWKGVFILTK